MIMMAAAAVVKSSRFEQVKERKKNRTEIQCTQSTRSLRRTQKKAQGSLHSLILSLSRVSRINKSLRRNIASSAFHNLCIGEQKLHRLPSGDGSARKECCILRRSIFAIPFSALGNRAVWRRSAQDAAKSKVTKMPNKIGECETNERGYLNYRLRTSRLLPSDLKHYSRTLMS